MMPNFLPKLSEDYGQFDQVSLLTDDNDARGIEYPSKKNIETKIEVILSKANPEDFFLFYFSGHGMSDSKKRGYVFQPMRIQRRWGTTRVWKSPWSL
jgi:uncharacterized caspase-like protein